MLLKTIPLDEEKEGALPLHNHRVLATLNYDGTKLAVYERINLCFICYEIDLGAEAPED